MRLGQLARKLDLRTVQIVDFLATQDIWIEDGSNTKLEEDHVALLLQQFAPIGADLKDIEEETEADDVSGTENATIPKEDAILGDGVGEIDIKEKEDEKVELIKATKVELSGLKVLGKIDLPEPKKKAPLNESTPTGELPQLTTESTKPAVSPSSTKSWKSAKSAKSSKSAVNPVALQRERHAREAEEKKREQIEREKEQRTLHYLKKMNAIRPTKAMKIVHDEPAEETPEVAAPPPRTRWGRFTRWLNT